MCLELMMPSFVLTFGNRRAATASKTETSILATAPVGETR